MTIADPHGIWTIIVAAGTAQRFGGDKLGVVIDPPHGTVLDRSITVAMSAGDGVVVVVGADSPLLTREHPPELRFVAGGATRSASVRAGLAAVPATASVILVHDGARPLASAELYRRVIDAIAGGAGVVIPVVAVVDTIRAVAGGVVDRDGLRAVQTPQGFRGDVLRAAHAEGAEATDDAALAEALGAAVTLVEGETTNLKITRPVDLVVARSYLEDSDDA
ncbi:MAG: 2-C-methyl-D-erythritol 4-phosphate cytidylyltransferase [Acidimicrobiales bacterium]